MQKRLTDASVERLKADPKKRLEVQDLAVPGLRLRITPSGKKSWSVMYKVAGEGDDDGRGKNKRMTLGEYPFVGVAAAHEKARAARDLADLGIDPKTEKQAEIKERQSKRIDLLVTKYIDQHAKPNTKNWKATETLLKTTVAKHWSGREIGSIARSEIHDYLDHLIDGHGVGKAREVRKHFSIFLNWCVDRGVSDANPMAGMKRKDLSPSARDRVLAMDEVSAIWKAAEAIGYPFGTIVQLLILTGLRRGEVSNMRRSWLDENRIEIPPENYKTGIALVVPTTDTVTCILAEQPRWNRGDYVFSTTNGLAPFSGFSKAKAKLDDLLNLEHWTLHDLRRSVATHMADLGVMQEHIERVLGHKITGVAGTYNRHSYFEQKLEALKKWEASLNFLPLTP